MDSSEVSMWFSKWQVTIIYPSLWTHIIHKILSFQRQKYYTWFFNLRHLQCKHYNSIIVSHTFMIIKVYGIMWKWVNESKSECVVSWLFFESDLAIAKSAMCYIIVVMWWQQWLIVWGRINVSFTQLPCEWDLETVNK